MRKGGMEGGEGMREEGHALYSCTSKNVYEFHVKSYVIIVISTCTHACFSHHSQ